MRLLHDTSCTSFEMQQNKINHAPRSASEPQGAQSSLNDCQNHKPDALGGSRWINKDEDYIKSLLKPRLLHNTPSVETV